MEDAVTEVVDALNAGWLSANTDHVAPVIGPIFDYKRPDTNYDDYVLCHEISHIERPASIGYTQIDYTDVVSMDIRTSWNHRQTGKMSDVRGHLVKMRDETRRIIYSLKTTLGGYRLAKIAKVQDLSDKSIGLGRMIVDVELHKVLDTVPA